MNTNVIDHLEKNGKRAEVDDALVDLGLARKTLNDPTHRQRLITALEERFPGWRKDSADGMAK